MEAFDELARRAQDRLPDSVWRYVQTGAGDDITVQENMAAWRRWRLRNRVLTGVGEVDTAVSTLGVTLPAPVAVAPTSLQRAADPDGEVAMAQGVRDAGSLLVVSSNAGRSFADIAATGVRWWLQLYLTQQRELSLPVLSAGLAAGAEAVVLTVDTPVVSSKPSGAGDVWSQVPAEWVRTSFAADADAPKARDLGPADVEWLRERAGVPVVLKGVMRPADAVRGLDAGAAAIWVSNHGGRQLDRNWPTATALPGVADACRAADVPVYVDGGIRGSGDLLTATALGARIGFIGRAAYYALAAGGAQGVRELLDRYRLDLAERLLLAGLRAVSDADPSDLLDAGRRSEFGD